MLHSLKKRIGLAHGSLSGDVHFPPEVHMLKQKLNGVRDQIRCTTSYVDKANDAIKVRINEQAMFAKTFFKGFPLGPDALVRDISDQTSVDLSFCSESKSQAEAFAKQSQSVYDQHCRSGSQDEDWAKYANMSHHLKCYTSAITRLDAKYPKLLLAKSEFTRYSAKFDSLYSQGTSDDLRLSRNLQKSDHFKSEYQTMLGDVLSEQRALYSKAPTALKIALVLYWGVKDLHMELMSKTFDETTPWAKEQEEELVLLNIDALDFPVGAEDVSDVQGSLASSFQTANSQNMSKAAAASTAKVEDGNSPTNVTQVDV